MSQPRNTDFHDVALERRLGIWVLFGCITLQIFFSGAGWEHSLREIHEFRQIQTALSAKAMMQGDWRIDYPLPLFGPPWSAPLEFPLYQGCVAVIAQISGWPLEPVGRGVSLVFFLLCLPALYRLQQHLPIPRHRWTWLPALVAVSPVYAYYSRAFMIESAALCAALWFLHAFGCGLRNGWGTVAAASMLGIAAGLVKSTTLAPFLGAAALLAAVAIWNDRGSTHRVLLRGLLMVGPALVAVAAWTRYTDSIKESNALTQALTSARLSEFMVGTWSMRLDGELWLHCLRNFSAAVLGPANAMFALLFGLVLARGRRAAFICLSLCLIAAPLTLLNLYAVHDYYFYAVGLFALAAVALALSTLFDAIQYSLTARAIAAVAVVGLQVFAYATTYWQTQRKAPAPPPEIATVLKATTAADDIIVIIGEDWNPLIPYFAERRAIMVTDGNARSVEPLPAVLSALPRHEHIGALVLTGEHRRYPDQIRDLVRRLGLAATPAAMSNHASIYLTPQSSETASARLADLKLVELNLTEFQPLGGLPQRIFGANTLTAPQLRDVIPTGLREIRHPFNIAFHDIEARISIDAHAPTDIVLGLEAEARLLLLEFGIIPGAWQASPPTDGIEFQVELHSRTGAQPKILFRRLLDPMREPAHRRKQEATVALPSNATGVLRLRTLPGPAGSVVCDWGYWSRIELK